MSRVERLKPCDRCQQTAPVLYRVKYEKEGDWVFVCNSCLPELKQDNLFYVYGGTWKAKKK
jgi:hypothetical protein